MRLQIKAEYDTAKSTVSLSKSEDESDKIFAAYSRPDAEHVLLQGTAGTNALAIRLQKIDTSKFLLINRGFHWINELPFNR